MKQIIEQARYCTYDDKMKVVRQMKKIVPEFKSNESVFEVLDKKGEA